MRDSNGYDSLLGIFLIFKLVDGVATQNLSAWLLVRLSLLRTMNADSMKLQISGKKKN
jgi:hypothetical protein